MNFSKLGLAGTFLFAGLATAIAGVPDRTQPDTSIYLRDAAGQWVRYVPATRQGHDGAAAHNVTRSPENLQVHEQPSASDTQAIDPRY